MSLFKSTLGESKKLIRWAKDLKIILPPTIEELPGVTKLDLSYRGINKLPKFISCLTNLSELNLSYNNLTALPSEIKNFKDLTLLDLGYNRLTELPSSIFHYQKLEVLNVEANNLRKIPAEIEHLKALRDLNLFANQVTELPDSIGSLQNLKRLNLAVNQIQKLPASFEQLTNIEILELWLNKFELIPRIITKLPKLSNLQDSFDAEKLNKTLINAVFANNYQLVEKLIFYGADVNYKLEGFGSQLFTTPLFEAKNIEIIKLLLDKGANAHLKRELIKNVLTKDGEKVKPTGKFETFLTKKHPPEIEKFVKKLNIPAPAEEESPTEDSSSDIFF